MQLFIDSAIIEEIKRAADTNLCDGCTTNPSLAAKAGKDYNEVLKEICSIQ